MNILYTQTLGELAKIPGTPYVYFTSEQLRNIFLLFPPLDRDNAKLPDREKLSDLKSGLTSGDDARFTRYFWEVNASEITISVQDTFDHSCWIPIAKGGHRFYHDISTVVFWQRNGQEIRNHPSSVIRNEQFFFREGIGWIMNPQTGGRLFERIGFYYIPRGVILAVSVSGLFSTGDVYDFLGLLNSEPGRYFIVLMGSDKDIPVGYIARVPAFRTDSFTAQMHELWNMYQEFDLGNEISTKFYLPWILQVWNIMMGNWHEKEIKPVSAHPFSKDFEFSTSETLNHIRTYLPPDIHEQQFGLVTLANICCWREKLLHQHSVDIQESVDEEVYSLYGITEEDRTLIETYLNTMSIDAGTASVESTEDVEENELSDNVLSTEEHLRRLVHYLAHEVLKEDDDGIIPLEDIYLSDGRLEQGLTTRVSNRLSAIFGEQNLPACERDLQSVLGMPLGTWLETEFFNFHVGFYRLRPIIWQIVSRQRGIPAFSCYVFWHKLDEDTLRKVQQLYLRPLIDTAHREAERAATRLAEKRAGGAALREVREAERQSRQAEDSLNELVQLQDRIQRLLQPHTLNFQSRSAWVVEKVNEIIVKGYHPVRDYGVRVNIEPLKKAGILSVAAERVKG